MNPYKANNAPEGKMMNTYIIELFKAGEYEDTKKVFVVGASDRYRACIKVREAFGLDHLNAFAGKKLTNKAADKLVAEGATDMRTPKIATPENRRRLGALVGR